MTNALLGRAVLIGVISRFFSPFLNGVSSIPGCLFNRVSGVFGGFFNGFPGVLRFFLNVVHQGAVIAIQLFVSLFDRIINGLAGFFCRALFFASGNNGASGKGGQYKLLHRQKLPL